MKLSNLATVLRAAGLTVVETPGWATRGYAGQDLVECRGILWHHTATGRDAFISNNAPTLNLCIMGRSDLPGPLCNIVFGRDGTVYLVAAGVANHAGEGIAPGIPQDAGNYYLIGIEMESSGVTPWDWTEDQIRVAPHLGAALEKAYLSHLAPPLRLQMGHMEYSSVGKIDPAGWPGGMDGLRESINAVLAGTEDDDMAMSPQEVEKFVNAIWDEPIQQWNENRTKGSVQPARFLIGNMSQWIVQLRNRLDTVLAQNAALTEAVRQLAIGKGIDPAAINTIVEEALRKATEKINLDVTVGGDN